MTTAIQPPHYTVQLAPDGRRFEVIERATLQLSGCFYSRGLAQARADFLNRNN